MEQDGSCSLRPPPSSISFVVLLSLLTVIIGSIVDIPLAFIMDSYAAKRPKFEKQFVSINDWLGSERKSFVNFSTTKRSNSADLVSELEAYFESKIDNHELHISETDHLLYNEFLSVSEEAIKLLSQLHEFIEKDIEHGVINFVQYDSIVKQTKVNSILKFLKLYPDGSPIPMSIVERFTYFSYQPRFGRLESKLVRSRKKVKQLRDFFLEIEDFQIEKKETVLLQFFLLEHFSSFKQWVLTKHLQDPKEGFEFFTPESIDPIVWFASWILILFSFLLFIYWILNWGITNGNTVFKNWGINFVVGTIQDIFFVQIMRVFIIHVAAVGIIYPQVKSVYNVYLNIAILHAQKDSKSKKKEVSLVQSLSPTCRLAKMNCCKSYASAKILNDIDDADLEKCRQFKERNLSVGIVALLLLPVILSQIHMFFSDFGISVVLPSLFSGFLMLNSVFFIASPTSLISVYVVIFCLLSARFIILFLSAKSKYKADDNKSKYQFNLSRRRISITHKFIKYCQYCYFSGLRVFRFWILNCRPKYFMKTFILLMEKNEDRFFHKVWKNINIPHFLQCSVDSANFHKIEKLKRDEVNLISVFETVPSDIREVRCSYQQNRELHLIETESYITNHLNKKLFLASIKKNENKTAKHNDKKNRKLKFSMPVKIHSIEKAKQYMIQFYVRETMPSLLDSEVAKFAKLLRKRNDLINWADIWTILEELLSVFHLSGASVTKDECQEIMYSFYDWAVENSLENCPKNEEIELGQYLDSFVSCNEFLNWFEEMCERLKLIRNFSHSMITSEDSISEDLTEEYTKGLFLEEELSIEDFTSSYYLQEDEILM